MHGSLKKDLVFVEKKLKLYINTDLLQFKRLLVPNLCTKFGTKVQNTAFYAKSNLGLCGNSITLNISLKS